MTILIVTNMFPTAEDPSYGCFVKSQVDSLARQGLSVDLIFANGKASRLNYLRGAWQVFWRSLRTRYDIVHAHYGLSGPLARCQIKSPVVVSFCGSDVMNRVQGKVSRFISRLVDLCIVKSSRLQQALGARNVRVLPNGLDLSLFHPQDSSPARKTLGLSAESRYILFVGDPARKEKRYDVAQQTFHRVRERLNVPTELVVLHGQPHREVPLYMNACDVLLLTSDYEGSPNAVKEAMACNMPIVSADVGDVGEILLGTRNCYVCPRDPSALAQRVLTVLKDGGRTDGRDRVLHLSLEKIAGELISIYQEVINRKDGRFR